MNVDSTNDKVINLTDHRQEEYIRLRRSLQSLLQGADYLPSVWSTTACVLYRELKDIYWAGFYMVDGGQLKVGAYQGTLGCLVIPFDRGVCGRAYRQAQVQIVENVHADREHIACDPASVSELVVPVFGEDGQVIAVLDLDSTQPARFDQVDAQEVSRLVREVLEPALQRAHP